MSTKSKAPWDKAAPKKSSHTKLTSADKQKAKRSASKAGRPYPNLVDNMKVAAEKKKSGNSGGGSSKSGKSAKAGKSSKS